jgi:hypothetical protein
MLQIPSERHTVSGLGPRTDTDIQSAISSPECASPRVPNANSNGLTWARAHLGLGQPLTVQNGLIPEAVMTVMSYHNYIAYMLYQRTKVVTNLS